jgi:dolichol-phosphate mannosyltransferase
VAAALVAQVVVAVTVPVLPEEAYHWNFARHLDWGYYDHPPMIAWGIALGRLVFGDTALGIRLVPLLWSAATAGLLARLARRALGDRAGVWAVLLYAVQPATFLIGAAGFPDAPLLFFWALTLTWVWQALQTGRPRWWLAAGLALGGGMLSKYTAAFLVPSVLLYLMTSRCDRRWLATPWPYLAGVCSLVAFLPVVYWNWQHDWASFRFQSTARFAAADAVALRSGVQSVVEQWLFIVPLTLPLAVLAVGRGSRSRRPAERFLFCSFVPTAVFFFVMGWTPSFHVLWPLPAYLGLTVLMAGVVTDSMSRLGRFYRTRWAWVVGLSACGLVLGAVHARFVLPGLPPVREMYGWGRVAQRAQAMRAALPVDSFYLVGGGRAYPPASQFAFHLGEPFDVCGQHLIGLPALQYQYWAEPGRYVGRDAVVVMEGGDASGKGLELLRATFQSVEPGEDVTLSLSRFTASARATAHFTFYKAHGYRGVPVLAQAP